jgi:hypothetical protein
MMDRDALLENWRRAKATPRAGARFRLTAPYEQPFVFRGPQWGHPSNYAAVRSFSVVLPAVLFLHVS